VRGCECRPGFVGHNCLASVGGGVGQGGAPGAGATVGLLPGGSGRDDDSGDVPDQGALVGVLVALFLLGAFLALFIYRRYRARLKRLKTELAHVHYIADPGSQPGESEHVSVHLFSSSPLDPSPLPLRPPPLSRCRGFSGRGGGGGGYCLSPNLRRRKTLPTTNDVDKKKKKSQMRNRKNGGGILLPLSFLFPP
jgi:hypothetical protein